ncbi:hypothetical protein [Streptomyces mayteni]
MTSTPRRVRITSPQTRIALSRGHRPPRHLLPLPGPDHESEAELAASRALFTEQRRHAARTLGVLALLLFGLSWLLGALPALGRITVAGVPASWLLLMAASYPLLLLIAFRHVRGAERIERASGKVPE